MITVVLISCREMSTSKSIAVLPFEKSDSIEAKNIETIRQLYKLIDEQKLEACKELYSEDAKAYMGSSEESFIFSDVIPFIQMYYAAFPDYQHHIENIFAADAYVVAQLKYTGTHTGEFMEIDSTGSHIVYKGMFIFKMDDGRIIEQWGLEDDLTLMSQLGLELK
jgi:steroid delta-isomerase-like uncharacterized protein